MRVAGVPSGQQVTNCSSNVMPVEARHVAIAAGATTLLRPPLDIYVSDAAAVAGRYCWVSLLNSQARL
jgi:hypothetical protein